MDAFREVLDGRVPENALLSHDLFEGVFARAGLVTDIELFDEFPPNYLVEASRQHRWARGDWQLLPWILGRARDAKGQRARNAMPGIARWKMVDNLRRTLSAPATVATLVVSWVVPGIAAAAWTAFVLTTVVVPAALPVLAGLRPRRPGISKRSHLRAVGADIAVGASQVGIGLALLAHQAWLMADAIVRTLAGWRRPPRPAQRRPPGTATHRLQASAFYRQMAGESGSGPGRRARLVVNPARGSPRRSSSDGSLPMPAIAMAAGLPRVQAGFGVGGLRPPAPPDGRGPGAAVRQSGHQRLRPTTIRTTRRRSSRTSPTNIGMYLLATVTARDFGWIGTLEMVERIEATLAAVDRLERFRGHLFNWYDTAELRRLDPMYVSTVDSGNLAGHLLTLASACRRMVDEPLPIGAALRGIDDAVALTRRAARDVRADRRTQTLTRRQLDEALAPLTGRATLRRRRTTGRVVSPSSRPASRRSPTSPRRSPKSTATRPGAGRRRPRQPTRASPATSATSGSAGGGARWQPRLADLADPGDPSDRPIDEPTPAPMRAGTGRRTSWSAWSASRHARRLFEEMDFGFLFDPTRKLFSIGFRALDGSLDPSYRPSRLGSAADELPRDREGRGARRALVPSRPRHDPGRPRLGPDLVVGLDVRIPDARARHARTGQPSWPDRPARRRASDRLRGRSAAFRGGSRNRRSTPATCDRHTSTRASASPVSGSSEACARTWSWRPTRRPSAR